MFDFVNNRASKDRHNSRPPAATMGKPAPVRFVVCGLNSKRGATSAAEKHSSSKQPNTRGSSTAPGPQSKYRDAQSTVLPKAHRNLSSSTSVQRQSDATGVQRSFPAVTCKDPPSLRTSTKDRIADDARHTRMKSNRLATFIQPLPRPSCIPRGRVSESVNQISEMSRECRVVTGETLASCPRNSDLDHWKPLVGNVPEAAFKPHIRGTPVKSKQLGIAEYGHLVTPTRNNAMTPNAVVPPVSWSPTPSPVLSSFPSQTWTVVADGSTKDNTSATTICVDEFPSSVDCTAKSKEEGASKGYSKLLDSAFSPTTWSPNPLPKGPKVVKPAAPPCNEVESKSSEKQRFDGVWPTLSRASFISRLKGEATSVATLAQVRHKIPLAEDVFGPIEYISAPTARSSIRTVIPTPPTPLKSTSGPDHMLQAGNLEEPLVEASSRVPYATITSRPRNCSPLAEVLKRSPGEPHWTEIRNGIKTAICPPMAATRTRYVLRENSRLEIDAPPKAAGINVSQLRKLFIPPSDKKAKVSKNATTQMEIEMLRARRPVTGFAAVNPHLDRLGSLSTMAIVTKLSLSNTGRD